MRKCIRTETHTMYLIKNIETFQKWFPCLPQKYIRIEEILLLIWVVVMIVNTVIEAETNMAGVMEAIYTWLYAFGTKLYVFAHTMIYMQQHSTYMGH